MIWSITRKVMALIVFLITKLIEFQISDQLGAKTKFLSMLTWSVPESGAGIAKPGPNKAIL